MAEDTAFAQAVAAEEDEQIKIAAGEGLDNLFPGRRRSWHEWQRERRVRPESWEAPRLLPEVGFVRRRRDTVTSGRAQDRGIYLAWLA